jgi:hypothetical protein
VCAWGCSGARPWSCSCTVRTPFGLSQCRGAARAHGWVGHNFGALQVLSVGQPPFLGVYLSAGLAFIFFQLLLFYFTMLLNFSMECRQFLDFFTRPSAASLCRGTKPPDPTLGFPGRPDGPGPGIRSCRGRAGSSPFRGRSGCGPGRVGLKPAQAGPVASSRFGGGFEADLGAAAGPPDFGMHWLVAVRALESLRSR